MKTRKKTKLCLQCNGVNPISASHCAYCGAILASDEPLHEQSPAAPTQSSMGDLFANPKEPVSNSPYTASRPSHPFVQDREPVAPEESVNKPLYSVFDQPLDHQMGDLSDEIMENPSRTYVSTPADPLNAHTDSKSAKETHKLFTWFHWDRASLTEIVCFSALTMGIILSTLSLLTLLFEHEGKINLSWSTHVAPWLFLVSAAFIATGWYALGSKRKHS